MFCHYNKLPGVINFLREEVYFGSQCWRFQSVMIGPVTRPVVRQHIMAGVHGGWVKLLSKTGGQDIKEEGRDLELTLSFKGTLPSSDLRSSHKASPKVLLPPKSPTLGTNPFNIWTCKTAYSQMCQGPCVDLELVSTSQQPNKLIPGATGVWDRQFVCSGYPTSIVLAVPSTSLFFREN